MLKDIHENLKKLYREKDQIKKNLGIEFDIEIEIDRKIDTFNKGYWMVIPFAFDTYKTYAVKIEPLISPVNLPVVARSKYDFVTYSPSLDTFLSFSQLDMIKNYERVNYIKDNWETIEKLAHPFEKYTGNSNSFQFLKEYIWDIKEEQYLNNPDDNYKKNYVDFWNHYNKDGHQFEVNELLSKMIHNENFIPPLESKNYGLWTNRINNIIGTRGISYLIEGISLQTQLEYFWLSFKQPHGFDSSNLFPSPIPYSGSETKSHLVRSIGYGIMPEMIYNLPLAYQENPLFKALEAIDKSPDEYMGYQHMEAASIFDLEYNDPVASWNALVSASYWAGINGNFCLVPAWEAAIYLAEKNNWEDIHSTLKNQLDFYNKHSK